MKPRDITSLGFAAATATTGLPLLRPFKILPRPAIALARRRPRLQPRFSRAIPGSHVLRRARGGTAGSARSCNQVSGFVTCCAYSLAPTSLLLLKGAHVLRMSPETLPRGHCSSK